MRSVCLAFGFVVAVAGMAGGEDAVAPDRKEVLSQVRTLCRERDSYAAAEYVQSLGAPPVVAKAYEDIVFDLHDAKAVPEMVAMARAGLLYCLSRAQELAASAPEKAANWRRAARAMAFNLGSFTWPGWGDEGVVIAEADRAAGEEASRLVLRLATELEEGPASLSASHWLVGAHHLTARRYEAAAASFAEAAAQARAGKDRPGELMCQGYSAMTEILAGTGGDAARARFDEAVGELRKDGSEDAVFYADQLGTVRKTLAGR